MCKPLTKDDFFRLVQPDDGHLNSTRIAQALEYANSAVDRHGLDWVSVITGQFSWLPNKRYKERVGIAVKNILQEMFIETFWEELDTLERERSEAVLEEFAR